MTNARQEIEKIIENNYDVIFAFSVRALGCRQEAEDLTQDVCLSLAERLPAFRGECKLSSWLYRIVVNAARDRIRHSQRLNLAKCEWGERKIFEDQDDRRREDDLRFLREAMAHLDPTQRVTMALVVGGGFNQAEVAEILEVAPGTVAWRMSEIKKQLNAMASVQGEVA